MKKMMIVLSLCFFFFANFFLFSSELDLKDIKEELVKHFSIDHTTHMGKKAYFTKIVDEIKSDNPLSELCNEFVKENNLYLDYILKSKIVLFGEGDEQFAKEPENVIARFQNLTRDNTEFLELVTEFFGLFLKSKGQIVIGLAEKPKINYSLDDLKSIAIRFIMPVSITENGKIVTRICVAGEGLRDYSKRNIHLEAFSFDTIFNEIKKKDNLVFEHLSEYTKLAISLNLSTNKDDVLKRAQGLVWALFYKDESFEKILINGYQNKKEYLPFEIVMN